MMCRDLEKGKEKIHVKVEPSAEGLDHLEASDDEALDMFTNRLPLT